VLQGRGGSQAGRPLGWHAFRRGLATNLHLLGVDDKTIQAILRHLNVGLAMNICVKAVSKSQLNAMATLSEKLGSATRVQHQATRG
jgi:hypothetical protein